jgi:hypothetical protein
MPLFTGRHGMLDYLQIPESTDVDCFVIVGGGARDMFYKCQLIGEITPGPPIVRDWLLLPRRTACCS